MHDFDESEEGALREFVYSTVKNFAEQNKKAYQSSNLIDLMNKVVDLRRGEIFEEVASSQTPNSNAASKTQLSGSQNILKKATTITK